MRGCPPMYGQMLLLCAMGSLVAVTGRAWAGEPRQAGNTVNTWGIFGFTEGADTGDKVERAPFSAFVTRLSRKDVKFADLYSTLGMAYSISDRATVWVSGSSYQQSSYASDWSGTSIWQSPNDRIRSTGSFGFGASAGLKYRVLERGPSPFGLSVQLEPFWATTAGW